jgi:CRISPR-associated protein Csm2
MPDVKSIMTQDPTGKELVEFAKVTASQLVQDRLTTGQIRNIFTEVRKIEILWRTDPIKALRRLNLLKAKMSYQTARSRSVAGLEKVLSDAITEVANASEADRNDRFERFMQLFEAILAFHKSQGGRA